MVKSYKKTTVQFVFFWVALVLLSLPNILFACYITNSKFTDIYKEVEQGRVEASAMKSQAACQQMVILKLLTNETHRTTADDYRL